MGKVSQPEGGEGGWYFKIKTALTSCYLIHSLLSTSSCRTSWKNSSPKIIKQVWAWSSIEPCVATRLPTTSSLSWPKRAQGSRFCWTRRHAGIRPARLLVSDLLIFLTVTCAVLQELTPVLVQVWSVSDKISRVGLRKSVNIHDWLIRRTRPSLVLILNVVRRSFAHIYWYRYPLTHVCYLPLHVAFPSQLSIFGTSQLSSWLATAQRRWWER